MKYCQSPQCYLYNTEDRLRTISGQKVYTNRKRSKLYYNDNFCSLKCRSDWFELYGERCIDYIGRITVSQTRPKDSQGYWGIRQQYGDEIETQLGDSFGGRYSNEWWNEYSKRLDERMRAFIKTPTI